MLEFIAKKNPNIKRNIMTNKMKYVAETFSKTGMVSVKIKVGITNTRDHSRAALKIDSADKFLII